LNETAPRWENHSHPASSLQRCFALAWRHKSLAQTAPLARATNLRIRANRMPPHGFVQEPVPERPERLAVKPSFAPALRVQASSLSKLVRVGSPDPPSTATAGLPVPDHRRVTWTPAVSRTAGSGDPRRTKNAERRGLETLTERRTPNGEVSRPCPNQRIVASEAAEGDNAPRLTLHASRSTPA